MRLTTKGRFAVTAMIDLAMREGNGPVTLAGISQRQAISLSYLEQLFGKLRRHGIVESIRGPGGGIGGICRQNRPPQVRQIGGGGLQPRRVIRPQRRNGFAIGILEIREGVVGPRPDEVFRRLPASRFDNFHQPHRHIGSDVAVVGIGVHRPGRRKFRLG